MKRELASLALSLGAILLAGAAWRGLPAAGAEGKPPAREGEDPPAARSAAAKAREARLAAEAAALREEVATMAAAVQGVAGNAPPAGAPSEQALADLRAEIARDLDRLRSERRTSRIDATVTTLRLTFRHNVSNLATPFALTASQQTRWNEILDQQADRARAVLEAETPGPEHDARARALVEETHQLLSAVLDADQLKRYRKSPIDWFGGSLHTAAPGR